MEYKNTDFPQYRKLINGLRLYKINSNVEFEEIQILGDKRFHFKFTAEQYPEKLRIMDMLSIENENYQLSDAREWTNQITWL